MTRWTCFRSRYWKPPETSYDMVPITVAVINQTLKAGFYLTTGPFGTSLPVSTYGQTIKVMMIFVDRIGPKALAKVASYYGVKEKFIQEHYQPSEGPTAESAFDTAKYFIKNFDKSGFSFTKLGDIAEFIELRGGRVYMPDGSDGMLCDKCGDYYPYVEPNTNDDTFICPKHTW